MVNNLNQNVNNASWGSHQDNNNVSGLNLGWNNAQTKEPNSVFNNFNLPAFEDNSFRNGSGNFTHPDKISSDHYLMNGRPYNETCNISLYNGSSKDCAYNDAHNVAFSNSFHPNNMNGNGTTNSNFRREPQSNGPDYYRDLSMFADHNANSSVINNTRNISRTPYQRVARTHDSVNTHTNPCYYPSHYEYNFYPRHTR
ncbi:hypothetical protein A3Q56_05228 [Intoshia linei]|uniref:Uncharacterized protein n=1 Tax=Intoshia linei TaxID=1819745 RepID=A0A177AYQ9_9BILA|nr:hypothetical protein A3Q56_05228 [Intoshia linei]